MGILYRIGLTSFNWTSYQYIFMTFFVRCSGTVRLKNLTDAPVLNKTWLWFCAPIETALYFLLPSSFHSFSSSVLLPFISFFLSFFFFLFLFPISVFFSSVPFSHLSSLLLPFFPACLDLNKSQNSRFPFDIDRFKILNNPIKTLKWFQPN